MQSAQSTAAFPGPPLQEVWPAWVATLEEAAARLNELSGSTESEFLFIGSQLHDFYSRATAILQMSDEAVGLVAGEDVLQAFKGLQHIMGIMNDHFGYAEDEA